MENNLTSAVGQRLRKIYETLGYKQKDFAVELGISPKQLNRIVTGVSGVTDTTIKLISVKFNVNESWLKQGTGNSFKEFNFKEIVLVNEPEYSYKVISEEERDCVKKLIAILRGVNKRNKETIKLTIDALFHTCNIDTD